MNKETKYIWKGTSFGEEGRTEAATAASIGWGPSVEIHQKEQKKNRGINVN